MLCTAHVTYIKQVQRMACRLDQFCRIWTLLWGLGSQLLFELRNYLNSGHVNIPSMIEDKNENRMSFCDVNMVHEQGKFTTSANHQPTLSGIDTHFDSWLPSAYKIAMIHRFLYTCFHVFSDWTVSLRIGNRCLQEQYLSWELYQ